MDPETSSAGSTALKQQQQQQQQQLPPPNYRLTDTDTYPFQAEDTSISYSSIPRAATATTATTSQP
ncbi:hypothetical protein GGH95_002471, partial [Coemansia sp. RSA 1836]